MKKRVLSLIFIVLFSIPNVVLAEEIIETEVEQNSVIEELIEKDNEIIITEQQNIILQDEIVNKTELNDVFIEEEKYEEVSSEENIASEEFNKTELILEESDDYVELLDYTSQELGQVEEVRGDQSVETSILFTEEKIVIRVGEQFDLSNIMAFENAFIQDVTWEIDNHLVLDIDGSGVITAINVGYTRIFARLSDNKIAQIIVAVMSNTTEHLNGGVTPVAPEIGANPVYISYDNSITDTYVVIEQSWFNTTDKVVMSENDVFEANKFYDYFATVIGKDAAPDISGLYQSQYCLSEPYGNESTNRWDPFTLEAQFYMGEYNDNVPYYPMPDYDLGLLVPTLGGNPVYSTAIHENTTISELWWNYTDNVAMGATDVFEYEKEYHYNLLINSTEYMFIDYSDWYFMDENYMRSNPDAVRIAIGYIYRGLNNYYKSTWYFADDFNEETQIHENLIIPDGGITIGSINLEIGEELPTPSISLIRDFEDYNCVWKDEEGNILSGEDKIVQVGKTYIYCADFIPHVSNSFANEQYYEIIDENKDNNRYFAIYDSYPMYYWDGYRYLAKYIILSPEQSFGITQTWVDELEFIYPEDEVFLNIFPYYPNEEYVWTSSDNSIATVDDGIVHGVSSGTVTITATNSKGESVSYDVVIGIRIESIDFDVEELVLNVGESHQLISTIYPSNASAIPSAYWYSDNDYVAIVDENGVVTALSPGTAIIHLQFENDISQHEEFLMSKEIEVTVTDDEKNGLVIIDGVAYYYENGTPTIGLIVDDSTGDTYYSNEYGVLQKGFVTIDNSQYYFNNDYSMVVNQLINSEDDYYYFGTEGKMYKKGWKTVDGYKYYFDLTTGKAYSNEMLNDKGVIYYFNSEGHMVVNQLVMDEYDYYYFGTNGTLQKIGWKTINGNKYYFDLTTGKAHRNGVYSISGKDYYFDDNAVMIADQIIIIDGDYYYFGVYGNLYKNGWKTINANKYYFDLTTGAAYINKMLNDNGVTYYFNEEGHMVVNQLVKQGLDCYYFGSNGTLQKNGWRTIDGDKYYFDLTTGKAYCNGKYEINGKEYYFNYSSKMVTDKIVYIDGNYYYFGTSGILYKNGWKTLNENKYYFDLTTGAAYRNKKAEIDGSIYYFNGNGVMVVNKLIRTENNYYYFGANGIMIKNGWRTIDGNKYYFDLSTGRALKDGIYLINGKEYYFNSSAVMLADQIVLMDGNYYYFGVYGNLYKNGWKTVNGNKYYFDLATGAAYTRRTLDNNGVIYYFNEEGIMVINQVVKIDDDYYYFGTNGIIQKIGWKTINGNKYYFDLTTGAAYKNGLYEINGKDYYFYDFAVLAVNSVVFIDNDYYYFGEYGTLYKNGWKTVNGNKYYFNLTTGAAYKNGMFQIDGSAYYFNYMGIMAVSELIEIDGDYYYFGVNGTLQKNGWRTINGNKYYFDLTTGKAYKNGIYEINGKKYYFDEYGVFVTSEIINQLVMINNEYYYYDQDGNQIKNQWLTLGDNTYYFGDDGIAYRQGFWNIGDGLYFFNGEAVMQKDKLIDVSYGSYIYVESDGKAFKQGWKTIDGKSYYFNPETCYAYYNGVFEIDGDYYYFDRYGVMQTDYITGENDPTYAYHYYFGEDGKRTTGWVIHNDDKYFFDLETGKSYIDGMYEIDGISYYFNNFGKVTKVITTITDENYYTKTTNYSYVQLRDSLDDITDKQDLLNAIYTSMNRGVGSTYEFYCVNGFNCVSELRNLVYSGEFWSVKYFVSVFNQTNKMSYSTISNLYTYFSITYDSSRYTAEQKEQIINKINEVEVSLYEENDTDLQKVRKVYEYIIEHTDYDYDLAYNHPEDYNDPGYSAYGTLINGLSVCQGYAEAMALFLNHLGIDNYVVVSDNHAWNALYINGEWLHLDATWGDTAEAWDRYFLINTERLLQVDQNDAHVFDENIFKEVALSV